MDRLDICSGVSAFEYKDTLRKLQVYHLLGELLGVKGGSNVFKMIFSTFFPWMGRGRRVWRKGQYQG